MKIRDSEARQELAPELSDQYHKARKQFALFSGLLLSWVLIGIELPSDKPIFENLNVKLLTPNALPLILFVLVIYFGYRTAIEWCQSDKRRRNRLPSRIDIGGAFALGITSTAVYGLQRAIEIRIGDIMVRNASNILLVALGVTAGTMIGFYLRSIYVARRDFNYSYRSIFLHRDNSKSPYVLIKILTPILPVLFYPVFEFLTGEPITVALPLGVFSGIVTTFILSSYSRTIGMSHVRYWKKLKIRGLA